MPLLQWNEYDFISCLEVLPTVGEDQVWHDFEVRQNGLTLRLSVWQYESVVQFSLALEAAVQPLIELVLFVREGVVARHLGEDEWIELRDCVLGGSRFSYLHMGDVFDRKRHSFGHHVQIRVRPQIQITMLRAQ